MARKKKSGKSQVELSMATADDAVDVAESKDSSEYDAADAADATDSVSENPDGLAANEDAPSEEELSQGTREMLRPDEGDGEGGGEADSDDESHAEAPVKRRTTAANRRRTRSVAPKKSHGPSNKASNGPPSDPSPTSETLDTSETTETTETAEWIATAASKSLESMTRQWELMKGITDSITFNLTKISQQMQEVSLHAPTPPAIIERVNAPKVTLLHRITLGVSAAALILGLVGLSMTQSVREEIIGAQGTSPSPTVDAGTQAQSTPMNLKDPKGATPSGRSSVAPSGESTVPVKKSSELSRRYREIWRLRHGN